MKESYMADIKQDLLGLQYSGDFSIKGLQEADIDLNLNLVSNKSATVHGNITDGKVPISNATVKLFDSKGLPFKHTLTNGWDSRWNLQCGNGKRRLPSK